MWPSLEKTGMRMNEHANTYCGMSNLLETCVPFVIKKIN